MAKTIDEHIYLVSAGDVDAKIMKELKSRIPGYMPVSTKAEIYGKKELPQAAYDASRKQYMADMVTDAIARQMTIDTVCERVLVVTDADLYAPDLNFVFGEADPGKGICIISLARLKNEDHDLFTERALKEAIHELGHSRGLEHCPNPKCVMYFSNSISDTDKKRDKFCPDCSNNLLRKYRSPIFKVSIKPII